MKLIALYFALVAIWWLIVFKLVQLGQMKTLLLFLTLFVWQCDPLAAQTNDAPDGTIIRAAAVSGIDSRRLSSDLNRDISALAGTRVDRAVLTALAGRIESEHPDLVVAVRSLAVDGGDARVVFLVAPVANTESATGAADENINARYVVESLAFEGVGEERLSDELRSDLHAVVGTRLSRLDAERLLKRLRSELPGYVVSRRMARGRERGRLQMTILVSPGESMRMLHYPVNRSKGLYHSDQGFSGFFAANVGSRDWRVTPLVAWSNADDLIEEYDGFGVRIGARRVGSERVGFALDLTRFYADWRPQTRDAAGISGDRLYRTRSTVAPAIRMALTPQWSVTGGVSVTQLAPEDEQETAGRASNAFVFGVGHNSEWTGASARHVVNAAFDIRRGTPSLQSDYDYTRLSGQVQYEARWRHDAVLTSFAAGRINGVTPLFERFTLGDSTTLRGWDKFALAPLGGDRTYHGSLEFRHYGLAAFLDGGSVWNNGGQPAARFSTGVGFHLEGFFATVAFPLNTSDVRTVFLTGVRF